VKLKKRSNIKAFELHKYLTLLHFCGIIEGVKTTKTSTKKEEQSCERNMCRCHCWTPITASRNGDGNDKPELFKLLDEHLDWDDLIPNTFYAAFYRHFGRNRKYDLESFMKALFLQRIFHYIEDTQLLNTLRFSYEMRDYCGFDKVPDAAKLTRFKQDFCDHIRDVFERLVDLTEPICREMDEALADMLVFDTTGIESYVAENNPKFMGKMAAQSKSIAKIDPSFDASGGAASLLPKVSASNPAVKNQYINGHFCYAQKAAVISNGLGIVRHLELFDENFKQKHPELKIEKRTNCPELDKEVGDSTALKPVLNDFRSAHPHFCYNTFSADAAFDAYDNYAFLMKEYGFEKVVVPFNPRRGLPATDIGFNENGTPLCPKDGTPFVFDSKYQVKTRALRFKYVCPKTRWISTARGHSRRCYCHSPCSDSPCGRCIYVCPETNLRLYPRLSRDSEEFIQFYNRRTSVERSINSLKDTLGIANRKTSNVLTTKAVLFLSGIVQLLCVLLADKFHDAKLARRPRRLIA
jgi:hypothetical protein